ncbi:MAG: hypothetical protein ABI321_19870 [Polyangia bacterium]
MRVVLASLILSLPALADEPLVALRVTRVADHGKAAMFSIVVAPAPGLHLLDDGPLVLDIDGAGIDPSTRSLGRKDAVDPRAETPRFEIDVRPHRDATPTLHAHLLAWLCRGTRCRPVELDQAIPFERARTP